MPQTCTVMAKISAAASLAFASWYVWGYEKI
jgi:hypothetical protein